MMFEYIKSFAQWAVSTITRGAIVYIMFILLHYAASNLYPCMCTPLTVMGFIMSPFMVLAPHCEAMRWVIGFTGTQIRNMWIWIGGYMVYNMDAIITSHLASAKDQPAEDAPKSTLANPAPEDARQPRLKRRGGQTNTAADSD
jgi:hypothetical protein